MQGAQKGLGMASQAAGAAGPWGAVAGAGLSMIGQLMGIIKGPKQRRKEEAEQRENEKNAQLGKFKAAAGGQAMNQQTVAGGGTLPLPSPPVPQAAPVALPAPPQVQLQQPALGGQPKRGPLTGQRNNYMMKLLMQGDR